MCGEACIAEISICITLVLNAAIVKQSQVFCDDKRYLSALQPLSEEQWAPHTAIPVLERMDTLNTHVKVQYIIERHLLERVIIGKFNSKSAVKVLFLPTSASFPARKCEFSSFLPIYASVLSELPVIKILADMAGLPAAYETDTRHLRNDSTPKIASFQPAKVSDY